MTQKLTKEEEKGRKEYRELQRKEFFQKVGIEYNSVEWLDENTYIYRGTLGIFFNYK